MIAVRQKIYTHPPTNASLQLVNQNYLGADLPSQKHLDALLSKIEPLAVDTLACHHGSVLQGDPQRYYRAMRKGAADIVDAPFYTMPPGPGGP